jgi:hypothetical protein
MKLRQLALAANTLEPLRSQLFELLGIDADYSDPGVNEFGLENSVMTLGDTFLEIVAPIQPNTAVARTLARAQTDICGYMALLQVDDYADFDRRISTLHKRKVWEVNRPEVSACHIHPKDIGGAIVSFDQMRPPQDWVWAGPDWKTRAASKVHSISGIAFSATDPETLASSWAEVTGYPREQVGDAYRINFDGDTFAEFRQGERDSVEKFVIRTADSLQGQSRLFGNLSLEFVAA